MLWHHQLINFWAHSRLFWIRGRKGAVQEMKVILFLLSLSSFVGSALTLGRETGVAYFSRSSADAIFYDLAFGTDAIDLPLSGRGKRELFETCAGALQGLIYAMQTSEVRQAMDDRCAAYVARDLMRNPTYSAAYTVQMLTAEDPSRVAAAMVLSQVTAPSESWNAKLRLKKGLSLYGSGRSDADSSLRSDIIFLVQTHGGRVWLAGLYKQNDSARAVIVETIDARPASEKADFLKEVAKLG